jgi:hypothetical protein
MWNCFWGFSISPATCFLLPFYFLLPSESDIPPDCCVIFSSSSMIADLCFLLCARFSFRFLLSTNFPQNHISYVSLNFLVPRSRSHDLSLSSSRVVSCLWCVALYEGFLFPCLHFLALGPSPHYPIIVYHSLLTSYHWQIMGERHGMEWIF